MATWESFHFELYQRAQRTSEYQWNRKIWLGLAATTTEVGHKIPGYIGVRLGHDTGAQEFRAFENFWTSNPEARSLPGQVDLLRRPYLSMVHDAVWALLLAVHDLVLAGVSPYDGVALRDALRDVSFQGASGNVTFTSDLDLLGGSYEYVTNLGSWDEARGLGELKSVGRYDGATQTRNKVSEMNSDQLAFLVRDRKKPVCGDGLASPEEACDDGNVVGGDGCSAMCTVEPTHTCVSSRKCGASTCSPVIVRKQFGSLELALVVVGVVLVLILVCVIWMSHIRGIKLDPDEQMLRLRTVELRERLQITRKHGYILSTDKIVTWSRSRYVIIPKVLMDSAVQLMLLKDFDLDAFDAFCVLVANTEHNTDNGDWGMSSDVGFTRMMIGGEEEASDATAQPPPSFINKSSHLSLLRRWLLDLASETLMELSIGKPERMVHDVDDVMDQSTSWTRRSGLPMDRRLMTRAQMYRYFHSKMLKVRIFRDESCSLFLELKQHVQVFTNQLTSKCNVRFRNLIAEPCGPDLCRFVFAPGKGIIHDSPLPLRSGGFDWRAGRLLDEIAPGEEAILRQDDPRVCAVVTGQNDELEREMESTSSQHLLPLNELGVRIHCSEAVQVAQLHRRALLLDRAFKAKVIQALEDSYHVGASEQPINDHRKQSIEEEDTCHMRTPPSPDAPARTPAINAIMGEAPGASPRADAPLAATLEGAGGGLPIGGGGGGGGGQRAARAPCCGVALL